jgi:hypothetical protein
VKAIALQPQYAVGTAVEYIDRQDRRQVGKVRSIEGKWHTFDTYLIYTLTHPSYKNGQFHTGPQSIIGEASEVTP